jgi:hypothetical protein
MVPDLDRSESFLGPSLSKAKIRIAINKPRRKEDLNQETNHTLAPCREVEKNIEKGRNIEIDYNTYSKFNLGSYTEFGIGELAN